MRHRIVLAALALAALGCSARGHFTYVSTKNLDFEFPASCRRGVFEASHSVVVVLGFPIGVASLERAVDEALAKGDGNLLVNAEVYHDFWSVLLFGEYSVIVRGEVYRIDDPALLPQGRGATSR